MSRYTITVTSEDHTDPDATIGYDPPLRTFFLQACSDETGDNLALWLGTSDLEYETIPALQTAASSRGYSFMPLPEDIASQLVADLAEEAVRPPHDGSLAALLQHLQSKSPQKRPAPDPARAFFLGLIVTLEPHSILDASR